MATIPTIRSPLEFSKPQLKKLCLQASRGHPRAYEVLSQIDDELSEYNSQMSALDTQIVLLTFQRNQHNKYTTVSPGIETGIASEISALQIHIEILSSHRGVSYEHKRIISSFLSPLNRLLPNEILIKILVLACDEHDVARDLAPLGLASICHRWREVVLTSTELWSSFKITVSTTYQVPMRFNDPMRRDALLEIERLEMRLEKRINVYLERSGGHLLNLHVIDDNLKTPDTKIRLCALLTKLIRCSERWRCLTLEAKSFTTADLACLCDIPLPSLETLKLTLNNSSLNRLPLSWLTFTSNNLRTITTNLCLPFNSSSGTSSHRSLSSREQITRLTFGVEPNVAELTDPGILGSFPNLQHLGLTCTSRRTGVIHAAVGSVRNYSVSSLEINLWTLGDHSIPHQPDLLDIAMDTFTAPNLSKLTVKAVEPRINFTDLGLPFHYSFCHIRDFIHRSECALTALELVGLSVSDQCVVDLLQHLHSLVELRLEDPVENHGPVVAHPITERLLVSLHARHPRSLSPGELLVPQLKSLTLCSKRTHAFASGIPLFVTTVLSRWKLGAVRPNVSCLRFVQLQLGNPKWNDPSLVILKEPDMRVEILDVQPKECCYLRISHRDQVIPRETFVDNVLYRWKNFDFGILYGGALSRNEEL